MLSSIFLSQYISTAIKVMEYGVGCGNEEIYLYTSPLFTAL